MIRGKKIINKNFDIYLCFVLALLGFFEEKNGATISQQIFPTTNKSEIMKKTKKIQ